jgi:ABC-2 type transport system permease protein
MIAAPSGTTRAPISTWRAASLITALALRRLFNRASLRKKRSPASGRSATGRKRAGGRILLAVLSLLFLFNGFTQSTMLVHRTAVEAERRADPSVVMVDKHTFQQLRASEDAVRHLPRASLDAESWKENAQQIIERGLRRQGVIDESEQQRRREELVRIFLERGADGFRSTELRPLAIWPSRDSWHHAGDSRAMLSPLAIIASLLIVTVTLMTSTGANQELAKADSSFAWWFTFPVPARGLFLARVVELAVVNPLAWFFVFPFFSVVFWCAGHGWVGVPLGLASTLYVGLLAGSLSVVSEAGLRRWLSLRNVARVQALGSLTSGVIFMGTLSASYSAEWLGTLQRLASKLPSWTIDHPLMPMGIAAGGRQAWAAALGSTALATFAVAFAVTFGSWMVRDGLTANAAPHEGRRRRAGPGLPTPFSAVVTKELHLLFRDRTLLAQVFLFPIAFIGMQFVTSARSWSDVTTNVRHAGALAFAASSFVLATGACNTLAAEASATWIYFTVPEPIERILRQKTVFWCGIAATIVLVAFTVLTKAEPAALYAGAPILFLSLVGVLLMAFIATGVGALGTDLLESAPQRRVRASMVYLYLLLASLFAYCLYTESVWAKVVQLVLYTLVAYSLWQKVKDHSPFLLDPTAAPPPTLAIADGALAALGFFVLQGILAWLFGAFDMQKADILLFAFAGAGVGVAGILLLVLSQSGMPDLSTAVGFRLPRGGVWSLLAGLVAGVLGGALARGYLAVVDRVEFLRRLRDEYTLFTPGTLDADAIVRLIALAVVLAPIFEEFIFRAILYGGMRRSVGPWRAAAGSALVFAIVHPPIGCLPVFVMGFLAAVVYERSRSLLAPIVLHMSYNAVTVGFALK